MAVVRSLTLLALKDEVSRDKSDEKVISISAAILVAASGAAFADHHMKGEGGMKMMDTNKDGMISKDEFMKHHEMMWDKMKKNSAGSVDMKDMEAMHKEMMMKKDEKKK